MIGGLVEVRTRLDLSLLLKAKRAKSVVGRQHVTPRSNFDGSFDNFPPSHT